MICNVDLGREAQHFFVMYLSSKNITNYGNYKEKNVKSRYDSGLWKIPHDFLRLSLLTLSSSELQREVCGLVCHISQYSRVVKGSLHSQYGQEE